MIQYIWIWTAALTHLCSVRRSLVSPKQTADSLFVWEFGDWSRAVVVGAKRGVQYAVILGCRAKQAANASVSYITQALWGWHSLWLKSTMGNGPLMLWWGWCRLDIWIVHMVTWAAGVLFQSFLILCLLFSLFCSEVFLPEFDISHIVPC